MEYLSARVLGLLLQPSILLLTLITISAIGSCWNRRYWIRPLIVASLALALCAWTPLSTLVMRPLEQRFPIKPLPKQVTGIIVLGGAFNLGTPSLGDTVSLNERAERMIAFAKLARQYPSARLVFSGGTASIMPDGHTEAAAARRLLESLGIDVARCTFEAESRNTRENALFTKRLIDVQKGQNWLLVTSAADIPRAVGTFRAVDFPVIPNPVDFHAVGSWNGAIGISDGLEQIDWATHEWLGLLYYRIRGWTPDLFPAPKD